MLFQEELKRILKLEILKVLHKKKLNTLNMFNLKKVWPKILIRQLIAIQLVNNNLMLKSEQINLLQMIRSKRELLGINMLKESWSRKKEIKNRLLKEKKIINLLKQSNLLSLDGTERKRKEIFRPTKIMIVRLEKILISSQNGTKAERF